MSHYIGPERRKARRRWDNGPRDGSPSEYWSAGGVERRIGPNRRQEALSGVIAGLTAEQVQELAEAWRELEATTREEA